MKYTQTEWRKAVQEKHPNLDASRSLYLGSKIQVTLVCIKHGAFEQWPPKAMAYGCPECGKERGRKLHSVAMTGRVAHNRKSSSSFVEQAIEIHGQHYDYSAVQYEGRNHKVVIKCSEHGVFQQRPADHLAGQGCPECGLLKIGDKLRTAPDDFIKLARKLHGSRYDYSKTRYVRLNDTIVIGCPVHGDFEQVASNHTNASILSGCPKCGDDASAEAKRMSVAEFKSRAKSKFDGRYDYSKVTVFKNQLTKVTVICSIHGEFKTTVGNHLHGVGHCPACSGHQLSSHEFKLTELLRSKGLRVETQTSGLLKGRRSLDLVLPDHKLAIEINGVYWHSEQYGKGRDYHVDKTLECRAQGLKLLHFWDYEVESNADLVVSMIRNAVGRNRRNGAREYKVVAVDNAQIKPFFEQNHLQGHVACSYAVALMDSDNIVSAMTFGKPRFDRDCDWELLRFATCKGLTIAGGASRLLRYFELACKPKQLVSYADLRISQGTVYKALGFEFKHRSKPNYFYTKGPSIVSRYKAQKHKLANWLPVFDSSLSEKSNLEANGYHRVWDCGNLVYIKHYNPS